MSPDALFGKPFKKFRLHIFDSVDAETVDIDLINPVLVISQQEVLNNRILCVHIAEVAQLKSKKL